MMKKILSFIVCIAVIIFVFGCNNIKSEVPEETNNTISSINEEINDEMQNNDTKEKNDKAWLGISGYGINEDESCDGNYNIDEFTKVWKDTMPTSKVKIPLGLYVTNIEHDSPLSLIGLKSGIFVTEIDNVDIIRGEDVVEILSKHLSGDEVEINVFEYDEDNDVFVENNYLITLGNKEEWKNKQKNAMREKIKNMKCIGEYDPDISIDEVDVLEFDLTSDYSYEWVILDKTKDSVLLLSKKIIDGQPYNTYGNSKVYENSSLREWLQKNFYGGTSFELLEEIDNINLPNDKVGILSKEDIEKYFRNVDINNEDNMILAAEPNEHAKSILFDNGMTLGEELKKMYDYGMKNNRYFDEEEWKYNNWKYWIKGDEDGIQYINGDGRVYREGVVDSCFGVRPVIRIGIGE